MEKIERVEDQDKLLVQNSIKYLHCLTKIRELNVPTLKSLYRTKCRLMELRRHVYLPSEKPNNRCQRCFMNFSEGKAKYEVTPAKLGDFAKKVLRKVKNKKNLTKFQKKYYKKLKKKFPCGFESKNKMVITCDFCKKELDIWMTKPRKNSILNKKNITPAKKKKKSRKDKFCGLNENAVLQTASKRKKHDFDKLDQTDFKNESKTIQNKNDNTALNVTVSMTNTRVFETADFIPLETKKEKKIKFAHKSKNQIQTNAILKSKEKYQKKKLKNLSNILKNANEKQGQNKNKKSNLNIFLSSL